MTIQQILSNIRNKTYGEDVRQAIIDGLQLCYTDKVLGGYCPVDNLNNYYSGAAFCTSSTANSPFQSSFIVMCAGNSTNCFQVAINASNINDGYVRNKKNNSWSAWMRLGVSKKIRYWNYDGSELLYTESVSSGGNGIWTGTSTRESTQQYNYTFVGWNTTKNATTANANATKNITANRDVYAAFTPVLRSYNVYFFNGTSLLKTVSVPYGSNATFDGSTPTKDSTAQYDYSFVGWNSHNGESSAEANVLNNIQDNKNVYAAFTSIVRFYNVYFYNGSSLIFTDSVEYGSDATFEGTTPTKESTSQYVYTFSGWNTDSSAETADVSALTNVVANRTVYAMFTSAIRTYTVRFMNGTTVLQTINNVPYGGSVEYSGENPQHPTAPDDYAFIGFNPTGENITGDTDCQAVYVLKPKELRYWSYDGTELLHTELVEVGGDGTWNGTSSRETTEEHSYIFLGWSTSMDASVADPNATKNITTNRDVYAAFEETVRSYSVRFYNGSILLYTALVQYGESASYTGTTPTKESSEQYNYTFSGWNSQDGQSSAEAGVLDNIIADKNVYAAFTSELRYYHVYFYNGSTLLSSVTVQRGNSAVYDGTAPTKESSAQYSYTFAGWNSQDEQSSAEAGVLDNIIADKNVYAAFSSSVRSYDVTFYNGSTLLQTVSVQYGEDAVYSGTAPTKAATAQYTYTFSGWNTNSSATTADANALTNITAARTVYAMFTATTRSYNVTFYNGTTVLGTVAVVYGGDAVYSGTAPTKAATAQYTYTHSGWNTDSSATTADANALKNITAARNVYAMFTATTRYYDVKFYNGSTLLTTVSVAYNGTATYSGTTPTKAATAQYTYTFAGWNTNSSATTADANALKNITAARNVYAIFTATTRSYDVKFYNGSTLLTTVSVAYNGTATYSGTTPTKAATAQYTYTFAGWNTNSSATTADANALKNVTAARNVYAIFTAATRSYDVKFYNGSTLLKTVSVQYGGTATFSGTTPTKAANLRYTYAHSGWNTNSSATTADANALKNITAARNVYAMFSATSRAPCYIIVKETVNGSTSDVGYYYLGVNANNHCILLRAAHVSGSACSSSGVYGTYGDVDSYCTNFISRFNTATQNVLVNTTITFMTAIYNNGSVQRELKSLSRKCFALSATEYGQSVSGETGTNFLSALKTAHGGSSVSDATARKSASSNGAHFTRTAYDNERAYIIDANGGVTNATSGHTYYVRPAIAVNPNAAVVVSNSNLYLISA